MTRPIKRMGDVGLFAIACAVADPGDAEVRALVNDMTETMHAAGGVGLAAPQIGVGLRIFVFGFKASERYPGEAPVPLTALVNPWIEPIGDETRTAGRAACQSPACAGWCPARRASAMVVFL